MKVSRNKGMGDRQTKEVEQLQRRASGRVKKKQSRIKRRKVKKLTNYLFCQGCDGLFLLVKLFNIAGSLCFLIYANKLSSCSSFGHRLLA